eukprot:9464370-Alexandrium_andersonii.AAC.1
MRRSEVVTDARAPLLRSPLPRGENKRVVRAARSAAKRRQNLRARVAQGANRELQHASSTPTPVARDDR